MYLLIYFDLGITSCTDNLPAIKRWAMGQQTLERINSHILFYLKLDRKDDVTREAQPHRIKKDHQQLEALKSLIESHMNPFTECEDELFNISTGKAAPKAVRDFLLQIYETGDQAYQDFVQRVIDDSANFERPIKKLPLMNFASVGVKVKKTIAGKTIVLKMERNLFSQMLALSLKHNISIDLILSYPLTPIPLTLGQLDGSMNKTQKSVLYDILDAREKIQPPRRIDVLLVDAFFFLHLHSKKLPNTFGKVVGYLLKELCRTEASRIDFIFDQILTPSIKDAERDRRATTATRDAAYQISGPDQVRPANFAAELRNDNFKRAFINFLVMALEDNCYASLLGEKSLQVTQDTFCYSFSARNGQIFKSLETTLCSAHEEADTKIMAHLSTVWGPATVVVRTSDSDILAITVGNIWKLPENIKVFLEVGLVTNNTLRYINVTKIAEELGPELSKSIPAFHAFTGCDANPAFSRRGKKGPFSVLRKNIEYQTAFSSLGSSELISESTMASIEKFACDIYPKNKAVLINEARRVAFERAYKPTKNKPLGGMKGIDGSNLPPCQSFLSQQIRRTNYICFAWNNATNLNPVMPLAEGHGWKQQNGKYTINWFDGDATPRTLDDILEPNQSVDEEQEDEGMSEEESSSDEEESEDDEEFAI